jgi:hypothetical protein
MSLNIQLHSLQVTIIIAALLPTAFIAIIKPWKLNPMLTDVLSNGRKGLTLGPGIFFLLSSVTYIGIGY